MKKKLAAADPDQSRADFYDELLRTAEQNIKKDMQREDKGDAKVMQIKQKASLFTAERIGKDRWSARTETVNSGKTVLPENVVESLADTLHKLAANQPQAIDPADQSTYTVREDGETVRNEDENDKNS